MYQGRYDEPTSFRNLFSRLNPRARPQELDARAACIQTRSERSQLRSAAYQNKLRRSWNRFPSGELDYEFRILVVYHAACVDESMSSLAPGPGEVAHVYSKGHHFDFLPSG